MKLRKYMHNGIKENNICGNKSNERSAKFVLQKPQHTIEVN